MKLFLLFMFSLSIQNSFAFNFKIKDQEKIKKFLQYNAGKTYGSHINSLSWSHGYSSIRISQIECRETNSPCTKEAREMTGQNDCVISLHKASFQAKTLKGDVKKGSISFKDVTGKGQKDERCKWYLDRLKNITEFQNMNR